MIETVENAIQLVLSGICAAVVFRRADTSKQRPWFLLGFFYSVFFLGDLYWQLYLVFYHKTPYYSHISDFAWYGSYLFLLVLLEDVRKTPWKRPRPWILWLIPLFTVGMCVFYLQWGDFIGNLISAVLMTLLLWETVGGLLRSAKEAKERPFYWTVLLFCTMNYGTWTASCFWMGDTFRNPYFWFDLASTVSLLLFLSAVKKAVST